MDTAYLTNRLCKPLAHLLIAALALLTLSSCLLLSSAPESPDELGADRGTTDTGVDVSVDRGDQATPPDMPPDTPVDEGQDVEPQLASLTGNVSRSAEPQNGGVGPVYVAVLDGNPIVDMSASIVAFDVIASADLSDSDASVSYSVEDIPVSDEAYFIFAFLDDDNNASPVYPNPRDPDLVAIEMGGGVTLPTIELSEATEYELDIVLNMIFPF